MFLKQLIVLSILVSCIFSQCDTVVKIEPKTFHDSKFPIMINYQAPWCQQCLDFDTVYEQLAKKVEIFLGTFDCSVHMEHCQKIGINKFPTLIFHYDQDNYLHYNGSKNEEEIQLFLNTIKNLYQKVDNIKEIIQNKQKNQFSLYYESKSDQVPYFLQKESMKILQRNQGEFNFNYKINCDKNRLFLIKYRDDDFEQIQIQLDNDQNNGQNLVSIIESEAFSGIQQFSLKFENWGFSDQGQAVFILYSKNKISDKLMLELNQLALDYKNKIAITYIIEGQWNGTLIKFQERYGQIPKNTEFVFYGINDYNKYRQIIKNNKININDIENYINKIINHQLTQYYKSELPFDNVLKSGELFKSISGSQLIEMMNQQDQQKSFVLMFYSKFCPLCQRAQKMLDNFQKTNIRNNKMKKEKILDIYKIDGQLNEIPNIDIMTYPVVYIWSNGKLEEIINQNFDSREFYKSVQPLIQINVDDL